MPNDFITTIDSDDEFEVQAGSSKARPIAEKDDFDPDFEFDFGGGGRDNGLNSWEVEQANENIDVDDIIARKRGAPIQSYKERKRKRQDTHDRDNSMDNATASEADSEGDREGSGIGEDESQDEHDSDGLELDGGMNVDSEREEPKDSDGDGDDDDDGDEEEEEEGEGNSLDKGDEDEDEALESEDDASSVEDAAETARKDAFFSQNPLSDPSVPSSFAGMNLSRPLLRALTALSFTAPTPIQAKSIPLALLGRDILGSAVTGSGKTAAFMIPILERLCYRDRGKGGHACRVLVLCPTRELAVQCEAVGKALAEKGGMDVRFALLVGGLSLNAQAHTLRTLPDILIATPGRLIDHLTNTPSFTLSALDVLVIDEADRMLEAGFSDELEEIVKACPRSRQTMLFSATMTDSVDELVRLSLDKPIRVFVDPKRNTAKGLTQEFVRIRNDDSRSPSLIALCTRTVRNRCIIFFRSKALAHQMRVVFGLFGLKAAEMHGNMTQEQRLNALNDFKLGKVDYLLATDLASRGLDIKGVETVINYDMPGQLAQYTHRVGRTARAGRKGRSISLVGEADRKMLKAAIKQSDADQIRHRILPVEAVAAIAARLEDMKDDVQEVLKEEKEEKMMRQAEMELKKGQNMVEHEAEIFSRPARIWFQSEKEKAAAKEAGKSNYVNSFPDRGKELPKKDVPKRGKYDGLSRKAKRRKMAAEADAEDGSARATSAAIRKAKKDSRPTRITEPMAKPVIGKQKNKSKASKSTAGKAGGKKASAFDEDRGQKARSGHEGMRAKRVKVNLSKGPKSKGRKN